MEILWEQRYDICLKTLSLMQLPDDLNNAYLS